MNEYLGKNSLNKMQWIAANESFILETGTNILPFFPPTIIIYLETDDLFEKLKDEIIWNTHNFQISDQLELETF